MAEGLFKSWHEGNSLLWGRQPLCIEHRLHESPLLERKALTELIDNYPREHYSLVNMGAIGEQQCWREGDTSGLSGEEIVEAITKGRFWLNLRCAEVVDARYRALRDQLFEEIMVKLGGGQPFSNRTLGILVSSPRAQVYYHSDLPNQSLWQITGTKTVYVYPAMPPFVRGTDLEKIAIYELEVDLDYCDWFDDHAARFELRPGQMLHWPLNSPHRVENHDNLNVSVTTEYWSREAALNQRLNMANGTLRYRLGIEPRRRSKRGAGFFMKSALEAALSRTGWLERVRAKNKAWKFRLDQTRLGDVVELTP